MQRPGQGQTVKGSVPPSASASDNIRVIKVSFYVDGVIYRTDTSAPYSASWQSRKWSNGLHTVTARAVDAAGNVSEDTHGDCPELTQRTAGAREKHIAPGSA